MEVNDNNKPAPQKERSPHAVSRRDFLRVGSIGVVGVAGAAGLRGLSAPAPVAASPPAQVENDTSVEGENVGTVGQVDHEANLFHPHEILTDFDYGEVVDENGRILRKWEIVAVDKEFEVAPGINFPGWVYGSSTSAASQRAGHIVGQCPGPTLRCVEGELLQIKFTNASSHAHTMHFHGIHSAFMDGVPGVGRGNIEPGESFVYEFEAQPFGCHLYHCHTFPLKRHVHKGLYGAFIVDPDPEKYSGAEKELAKGRNHQYPESENFQEMIMVMNGFDTNLDGSNEVYAANSIAFAYGTETPIPLDTEKRQRLYLLNMTEFDQINSMHIHANFFDYYDHGTTLEPTLKIVDTIMQCQAQRGILEFSFTDFGPGLYMFHAHQSEFAELGWMGFFQVGGDA